MADSKISALPASTTPLAGTEVLPIVQSSATKQVSVANLTAGRAISATQLTLTTGNLIVANGQGINTSAAHAVTFNINSSEAARIHASKGVSIGNTVDPGNTNLSVTGSVTNASIKTGGALLTNNFAAPEIMFSAAGQGIYIVFAYIEAYDPNDWSAQATVTSSGAGTLKLTTVNNAGMQITVSGTDVLCQQIGGGSVLGTKYVYQKII